MSINRRPSSFGYVVLAAGALVHIILGTIYCWGNLTTYVTSYMREKHPTYTYDGSLWTYLTSPAVQAVTMPTVGYWLQMRVGARTSCLLGGVIAITGIAISRITVEASLLYFILSYGALWGCGVGLVYTCPIGAALSYLPHKKGLVTGIVTMGFGFGAFVINFVITSYANPHNCKPVCPGTDNTYPAFDCPGWVGVNRSLPLPDCDGKDKYFPPTSSVAQSVPNLLLLLSQIYGAALFLGCIFLVEQGQPFFTYRLFSTKQGGGKTAAVNSCEEEDESSETGTYESKQVPTGKLVRDCFAWQVWLAYLLTASGGVFIIAQFKTFGQKADWSTDEIEAKISSAMSIGNALGRLVHGSLCDRFGFSAVLVVSSVLAAVFQFTLSLTSFNLWFYSAWCVLIAFLYGGNFAIYPTAAVSLWGATSFSGNYAFLFTGFSLGALFLGVLNNVFVNTIGFPGMTIVTGSLTFLGAANSWLIHRRIVALDSYRAALGDDSASEASSGINA